MSRLLPVVFGVSLLCAPNVFGLPAVEVGKGQPNTTTEPVGGKAESKTSTAENSSGSKDKTDEPLVAASPYVATAYTLRGRTASGQMISRGLIAADPSILPLGSRVRLETLEYSGEYVVADTGGVLRGRRIDIWTPSGDEAMRFGRRTVKLTVLSYADRSPVMVRQELEKQYQERAITDSEYQARYVQWVKLTEETVKASAQYYTNHPKLYESAIYMPAKFGPTDPNEKNFLDTYYERFRLEIDLAKDKVSQAEYSERLSGIVAEENAIATSGRLKPADVARYYQNASKIQPAVASLQGRNWETDIKIGMIVVAILGISLKFYLGYKKDCRERSTLDLEKRKLELAELGSLFQVEEMKLKIAQLEQEGLHSGKRLILP